ncbi:MAG: 3-octaprenyl-4-hydroxybenzoate carboxy-lyase [Rhodospirillaceae bacterium]|nr:3-octaprenyl-4-hydroxybenzoate carboxy-lyase [Rhodospirillaceae bacterium]|tara:strand:+ start:2084 stop:3460 length:1377 start_codon:yes stop_codon:yes gene_type:complete
MEKKHNKPLGPFSSFRSWVTHLHASGRLNVAKPGIPLEYTLAAVAKRLDGEKATLFPSPGGHPISVVAGVVSRRSWIAEAIGVSDKNLLQQFQAAVLKPIPWTEIREAPSQEIQHLTNIDIGELLPIPVHNEHDNGAYITAGLVIARNPITGDQNVSINRLQISGPNKLGILILPRDLHKFYDMAEAQQSALSISIAIGSDPLSLLASQAILPLNVDELTVAGGLLRKPLEVTKGLTNDIRVPATSEIIIEGRLLPTVRETEGPFGEFPQYYGPAGERQVIEIDAITHRQDPIFHTIVPAGMEHLLLGAIPREASILTALQRQFSNVIDVHLSQGGVCRYHLHVKLTKRAEGEPKNVIMGAFASHADIKQVIIVDDDVDVNDSTAVEWAIATRFQASKDLIIVKEAQGSKLDPSGSNGLVDKMGLDATKPIISEPLQYTVVSVPGEEDPKLLDTWLEK